MKKMIALLVACLLGIIPLTASAKEKVGAHCENLRAISGDITAETFRAFSEINGSCVTNGYKTRIDLFSPGGAALAGIAAYDILRETEGWKNLTVHAYGYIASAATLVFMSGKERLISCNGQFMIHEGYLEDYSGNLDMSTLAALSKKIDRVNQTMAKIYSQATGIDQEAIKEMMAKETTLSAEEAVKFGFATGTIPPKCK